MNNDKKTPMQRVQRPSPREVSRKTQSSINLNSTVSSLMGRGSASKRVPTPTHRSNQTVRSHLDMTIVGLPSSTLNPNIKSSLHPAHCIDNELECQLAYNEYLQALIKNQICQNEVKHHEKVLEEQIYIHSEKLENLKDTYKDFEKGIETLKVQENMVEVLSVLEDNLEEICQFIHNFKMDNKLSGLHDMLNVACNLLTTKNIKQIKTQQEYDTFINTVKACVTVMERILSSGRNFEKVHDLAESMRNVEKLKADIETSHKSIVEMEKSAFYNLLRHVSLIFARKRMSRQ